MNNGPDAKRVRDTKTTWLFSITFVIFDLCMFYILWHLLVFCCQEVNICLKLYSLGWKFSVFLNYLYGSWPMWLKSKYKKTELFFVIFILRVTLYFIYLFVFVCNVCRLDSLSPCIDDTSLRFMSVCFSIWKKLMNMSWVGLCVY